MAARTSLPPPSPIHSRSLAKPLEIPRNLARRSCWGRPPPPRSSSVRPLSPWEQLACFPACLVLPASSSGSRLSTASPLLARSVGRSSFARLQAPRLAALVPIRVAAGRRVLACLHLEGLYSLHEGTRRRGRQQASGGEPSRPGGERANSGMNETPIERRGGPRPAGERHFSSAPADEPLPLPRRWAHTFDGRGGNIPSVHPFSTRPCPRLPRMASRVAEHKRLRSSCWPGLSREASRQTDSSTGLWQSIGP